MSEKIFKTDEIDIAAMLMHRGHQIINVGFAEDGCVEYSFRNKFQLKVDIVNFYNRELTAPLVDFARAMDNIYALRDAAKAFEDAKNSQQ